jgi:hypothetical protein
MPFWSVASEEPRGGGGLHLSIHDDLLRLLLLSLNNSKFSSTGGYLELTLLSSVLPMDIGYTL